jgi:hypothetical protein
VPPRISWTSSFCFTIMEASSQKPSGGLQLACATSPCTCCHHCSVTGKLAPTAAVSIFAVPLANLHDGGGPNISTGSVAVLGDRDCHAPYCPAGPLHIPEMYRSMAPWQAGSCGQLLFLFVSLLGNRRVRRMDRKVGCRSNNMRLVLIRSLRGASTCISARFKRQCKSLRPRKMENTEGSRGKAVELGPLPESFRRFDWSQL